MTIIGTSYFPNTHSACMYYRVQECTTFDLAANIVNEKISDGSIHIGKPPLKPGETLFIKNNRYFIQEP